MSLNYTQYLSEKNFGILKSSICCQGPTPILQQVLIAGNLTDKTAEFQDNLTTPKSNLYVSHTSITHSSTLNNPFTLDSSGGELILKTNANYALTLDSDILKLKNTNTTDTSSNHNAQIKTNSNNIFTTTFLKLQLDGSNIWIPYFTQDPST